MSWITYQSTYCKIISHLCIGLFLKEGMKSLSEEWEGGGISGEKKNKRFF